MVPLAPLHRPLQDAVTCLRRGAGLCRRNFLVCDYTRAVAGRTLLINHGNAESQRQGPTSSAFCSPARSWLHALPRTDGQGKQSKQTSGQLAYLWQLLVRTAAAAVCSPAALLPSILLLSLPRLCCLALARQPGWRFVA
jgi:hypothetical protein